MSRRPGSRRSPRRGPGRARGASGQSTVELALVLPVVVLLVLLVVEVAAIGHDQLLVTNAAREAARAVAVSPAADAPRRAAAAGGGLDPTRLRVQVSGRGEPGSYAETQVRYSHRVELPLVRGHVPDLELEATVTMRVES